MGRSRHENPEDERPGQALGVQERIEAFAGLFPLLASAALITGGYGQMNLVPASTNVRS